MSHHSRSISPILSTSSINHTMTITILVLLLAIPANNGVFAFAPPSKSRLNRARSSSPQKQSFSPLASFDASSLISDAADAVAAASSATYATDAISSAAVDDGSKSFTPTYSNASYYTTLALYVASFPGLWSQIKRSTKAKVKRKTYVR